MLTAIVNRGKARRRLKSSDGHVVPDLSRQAVELRHGGTVLAHTRPRARLTP